MDEFAAKLKRDAQAIDAEVPAALRARIDHGIAAARRAALVPARSALSPGGWLSAAVGLAAVATVVLVLIRPPAGSPAPVAATSLPAATPFVSEPLRIDDLRLTEPLQLELVNLRADLEKARETIERDLRFRL